MLANARKHRAVPDPRHRGGPVAERDRQRRQSAAAKPSLPASSPPRHSRPSPGTTSAARAGSGGGVVDPVLYRNLVEMIPMVESLMEERSKTSFTRRASMVHTPAPSSARKISGTKGRKATQSSTKNQNDINNISNKHGYRDDSGPDDLLTFSAKVSSLDNTKEREELVSLRGQVDDLQKKLLEKDEAIMLMENTVNQLSSVYTTVNELKCQILEKDLMIKSAESELASAKVALADKQAVLQKLELEAKASNKEVEKLQEDLDTIENIIAAFPKLLEELLTSNPTTCMDEGILCFQCFDDLPNIDTDETQMELARRAYKEVVAAAKENPTTDGALRAAAEARQRLLEIVL